MNNVELGNFLQNLIDEDVIERVDTDQLHDVFGKNNVLTVEFKKMLKMAVIDSDGNMIPFECDCIQYSSRGIIEFLINEELYLSRAIDEVKKIFWKMSVRMGEK